MKKTQSEIKQEKAGTLYRNRLLKSRWEEEKHRRGLQSEMARELGISRQAVSVIVNREDLATYYQAHHISIWRALWHRLIHRH